MRTRAPTVGAVEWFERGERTRVERVAWELRTLGIEHLRTGVSWAEWHVPGGAEWYSWLLPRLARDFELLPCVSYTPPSLAVVPMHGPAARLGCGCESLAIHDRVGDGLRAIVGDPLLRCRRELGASTDRDAFNRRGRGKREPAHH